MTCIIQGQKEASRIELIEKTYIFFLFTMGQHLARERWQKGWLIYLYLYRYRYISISIDIYQEER